MSNMKFYKKSEVEKLRLYFMKGYTRSIWPVTQSKYSGRLIIDLLEKFLADIKGQEKYLTDETKELVAVAKEWLADNREGLN